MNLATASDGFLAYCRHERRLSPLTIAAYGCDLVDVQRHFGKTLSLSDVDREGLKKYLAALNEARGLSVATVARRFATLRGLHAWHSSQSGEDNPFDNWRPRLKRPRRLPRALTQHEVNVFVSHTMRAGNSRTMSAHTKLVLLVLVATGLRISELCSLRVGDVTHDGSTFHVRGKGARERTVFVVNAKLRGSIKALRTKRATSHGVRAELFHNRNGNALTPASLRARMRRGWDGAKRVTPHMLRHTAATMLIESGVDIRYVQKLLGHASIATTEIYTHVADQQLRKKMAKADVVRRMLRNG